MSSVSRKAKFRAIRKYGTLTLMGAVTFILGFSVALNIYLARFIPRMDGGYDNYAVFLKSARTDLPRISEAMVRLKTVTEFKPVDGGQGADGGQKEATLEGTGIVLGHGFILTVAHSLSQDKVKVMTPAGPVEMPAPDKVSEKTFLEWQGKSYPLKLILKDKKHDVALLKVPKNLDLPSFPFPIGDSDELQVGNFVYVIGNPLNSGVNVREGIVSALSPPPDISATAPADVDAFMLSNGLVPGDSGTPVVAIRDGKLELVGISHATIGTTRIGWAIRINSVQHLLIDALRKQGWNCNPLGPGEGRMDRKVSFVKLLEDFSCSPEIT